MSPDQTDSSKEDEVSDNLVTEVEKQKEDKQQEQKKALGGLDGKHVRFQAQPDTEERAKLSKVEKTKKVLDTYRKREGRNMQVFPRLLGPINKDDNEAKAGGEEHKAAEDSVVHITREQLEAGKRVITLCDTSGASQNDTIVLTEDLSYLESQMAPGASVNRFAKEYPDDADNKCQVTTTQQNAFGIIKLFIQNVSNCTILIKCKVISGTVELIRCRNVVLRVEHDATVPTIQADLCQNIHVEFHDAPSGKNVPDQGKTLYWGDDRNDRIFYAGVTQMKVSIVRDGSVETERMLDYIADGAVSVGNATPEEYQFVTSVLDGELVTEKVVRAGATTGTNARAMTERELEEERIRREKAAAMLSAHTEGMIKIITKTGEVVKPIPKSAATVVPDDDDVEKIYPSITKEEIKIIVDECELNKLRGNEAFDGGEYVQALLHYNLALDKADELPDKDGGPKTLFPRHILLSERSACFLKLGNHEKALADATRAHTMEPTYATALFRRGLALHALGRYAETLPVLEEAYTLEPQNQLIKQALQFAEVRHEQEMRKSIQT